MDCLLLMPYVALVSINGKVYPKMSVNQVQQVINEYRKLGGEA